MQKLNLQKTKVNNSIGIEWYKSEIEMKDKLIADLIQEKEKYASKKNEDISN